MGKVTRNEDGTVTVFKETSRGSYVYDGKIAAPSKPREKDQTAVPPSAKTETPKTDENPTGVNASQKVQEKIAEMMQYSQKPYQHDMKGEAPPALSVNIDGYGRLYATHPKYTQSIMEDPVGSLKRGEACPSITNVQSYAEGPSEVLQNWRARMSGDAAEAEANALIRKAAKLDDPKDILVLLSDHADSIKSKVKGAADRHSGSAADRGTKVHAVLESLSLGENPPVDDDIRGYVDAYHKFRRDFPNLEFVAAEITVHNEEHQYMGTADGLVKDTRTGKLYILDWKTNKKGTIYEKVGLQLAAVANAEWIVYSDGTREPMPKVEGGLGVGLNGYGKYEVRKFDNLTQPGNAFAETFFAGAKTWHAKHVLLPEVHSTKLTSGDDI